MDSNQDDIREVRLGIAVRKAFEQLLKGIDSEPTFVIESDDSEDSVLEKTVADIRTWLFKRR